MKYSLLSALIFLTTTIFAQKDSVKMVPSANSLNITGYAEVYYTYDFNKPTNNKRPEFIYNHNRHNEVNLNLGFLKAAYNTEKLRVNLAIAAGTYMNANYAAEPETLKSIFEANAGLKISKKKNLWLDAGIFSSHIGFESAVSKDCWTLTRGILSDNTPYYESGARLTYTTKNNKWIVTGLVLNGWQRIKRVEGNSMLNFGTQLQFKPNATTIFNYSTFFGTDKPDSIRQIRTFHNLYAIFNATRKLGITAGFDIGTEQTSKHSKVINTWYSPVFILKYTFDSKWAVAARSEYYYDKKGVIISTGTPNGFQTAGISFNVDYLPVTNAVIRMEARTFNSKDEIFMKGAGVSDSNIFITSSLAVNF